MEARLAEGGVGAVSNSKKYISLKGPLWHRISVIRGKN